MKLNVNGTLADIGHPDPATPLLYILRNDLDLTGARFGCGLGQCGACTVHINGAAQRACVTVLSSLSETDQITTLEGLGTAEQPHPLQQAFIDEAAVQCGYCINGMIMQAADFLSHNKHPSEAEIKTALENNLCRCGTHLRIVRAVQRAAGVA